MMDYDSNERGAIGEKESKVSVDISHLDDFIKNYKIKWISLYKQ